MATAKDLPPGSDERLSVAFHAIAAASEPGAVIQDWGEYNEDYSSSEHHEAWGRDVAYFYNESAAPEDVKPTNLTDEEADDVDSNNRDSWFKLW